MQAVFGAVIVVLSLVGSCSGYLCSRPPEATILAIDETSSFTPNKGVEITKTTLVLRRGTFYLVFPVNGDSREYEAVFGKASCKLSAAGFMESKTWEIPFDSTVKTTIRNFPCELSYSGSPPVLLIRISYSAKIPPPGRFPDSH